MSMYPALHKRLLLLHPTVASPHCALSPAGGLPACMPLASTALLFHQSHSPPGCARSATAGCFWPTQASRPLIACPISHCSSPGASPAHRETSHPSPDGTCAPAECSSFAASAPQRARDRFPGCVTGEAGAGGQRWFKPWPLSARAWRPWGPQEGCAIKSCQAAGAIRALFEAVRVAWPTSPFKRALPPQSSTNQSTALFWQATNPTGRQHCCRPHPPCPSARPQRQSSPPTLPWPLRPPPAAAPESSRAADALSSRG